MKKFSFFVLGSALLLGALFVSAKLTGHDLGEREIFAFADASLTTVQEKLQGKNKLSNYLDGIAGACQINGASIAVNRPVKWSEISRDLFFPFARPFILSRPEMNAVNLKSGVVCRDSSGHGFELSAVNPTFLVVERFWNQPMRLSPLDVGRLRLSGRKLLFLWRSPFGDIKIESDDDAAVVFEIYFSPEPGKNQHMIVERGRVAATLVNSLGAGSPGAVLELLANSGAELKWGKESGVITSDKSGVVLPSGFSWR